MEPMGVQFSFVSRDGIELRGFEWGPVTGVPVALINAFGMPSEFMRPLALDLVEAGHHVLTWESRAVPNLEPGFTPENCGVLYHAHDLSDLLRARKLSRAAVVGWCSGAQVALRFTRLHPESVSRLVLVNGAYSLWSSCDFLKFQHGMNSITPFCAESPENAAIVSAIAMAQLKGAGENSDSSAQVASLLSAIPRELVHLTAGVFGDGERLYRYSNMEQQFLKEPEHSWADGVVVPTLVMTGDANVMANPESSKEIARRIRGSRLLVVPGGNHYMHYLRGDARQPILQFLMETSVDATAPRATAAVAG